MSQGGFTKKKIDLTITLGAGPFGEQVGDTVTLSGLRMTADIVDVVGDYQGSLQLRVFGLTQSMMNRLTTIGPIARELLGKNKITLSAGDDESGMTVIYQGSIINAWADYNAAPEVAFNLMAQAGYVEALKPANPSSFKGSADVATVIGGLAKQMGLAFENNGVSVQLANPYFDGTLLTQVQDCARAAKIRYNIDRGVLAIWPREGAREGEIPLISPVTGMVGYPTFASNGIFVTCVFNPDLQVGRFFEVESSVLKRSKWMGIQVSHSLSSEIQNGPWFTTVRGMNGK